MTPGDEAVSPVLSLAQWQVTQAKERINVLRTLALKPWRRESARQALSWAIEKALDELGERIADVEEIEFAKKVSSMKPLPEIEQVKKAREIFEASVKEKDEAFAASVGAMKGVRKILSVRSNGMETEFIDAEGKAHRNPVETCWQEACRQMKHHVYPVLKLEPEGHPEAPNPIKDCDYCKSPTMAELRRYYGRQTSAQLRRHIKTAQDELSRRSKKAKQR